MKNTLKKTLWIVVPVLLFAVLALFAVWKYVLNTDAKVDVDEPTADITESDSDWKSVSAVDSIRDYEYSFDLVLNVDNMTMGGVLDFTYYNNNEIAMDELVFYLYANSYEKEEYHAIAAEYFERGYPNGFSPGFIDIKDVDVKDGGSYRIEGSQNHLLIINLDKAVKPGKSAELTMEYTVTIPDSRGRFGYGDETISIVNCNPIMAVYDEEIGYYDYEYNSIGDPFFSECADYRARVTIHEDYLVVPTGTIEEEIHEDDMITYVIDGENRRDFGFAAGKEFKVLSEEVNGVVVTSYSFASDRINKKALKAAVDSVDVYSSVFGEYPYETFNVVQANFFIGGMEYPGMVLIGDVFYTSNYEDIMEMIIAHEAAHQWWYAQVGNDQIAHPWLDEALATFSERVYFEHVYPEEYAEKILYYVDGYYIDKDAYMDAKETRIDLNTMEYGEEYSLAVYGYGGWMMDDLRTYLGEQVFYEALQVYLEDNLFQIASREDLEQAIEKVTGEDITSWFDENLQIQVGN